MSFFLAFVNTLYSNDLNELKDLLTFSNFLIIFFEIISSNSVCLIVLLNFQSFLQWTCSPQPIPVSALLQVLVNLKGLLKGLLNRLLNALFAFYSNFAFVGIGGEYPFWKLAFQNRKLGSLEIVDEDDCVKLAGVFTFFFRIALCAASLIFLCVVRIPCHGVLFVFLHYRPSRWQSIS